MNPRNSFKRRAGLSCVQLVAVFAALVIGAAILLPNFLPAKPSGQLTACKSNLRNIATALEMYATDYSGSFPTSMDTLTPNYLRTVPTCPAAGRDTYTNSLTVDNQIQLPVFRCPTHRRYEKRCRERCLQLQQQVLQSGKAPPETSEQLGLSAKQLECPEGGGAYEYSVQQAKFEFFCQGNQHRGVESPQDYPRYNSWEGLVERP